MRTLVLTFLSMLLLGTTNRAIAQGIEGTWFQDDGDRDHYHIQIAPCARFLCGSIVWMSKPNDDRGQPRLDTKNPDRSLRSRPILGVRVGLNIAPKGPNRWEGRFYSPKRGATYALKVSLRNANALDAFVGPPVFGQTLVLTRVQQ